LTMVGAVKSFCKRATTSRDCGRLDFNLLFNYCVNFAVV
jgi:hypothetical protein